MKKKTWIWLLTAALIAVMVLPAAVSAADAELWVGAKDTAKYPSTYTISPDAIPEGTTYWQSADESVATVSNGVVTAVGAGETEIFAFDADYAKFDTVWTITVKARKAESLTLKTSPSKTEYADNQSFSPAGMVVDVTYNNGEKDTGVALTDSNCSWAPSGKLDAGTTSVVVTYDGASIPVDVTVEPFGVKEIKITDTRKDFNVGDTLSEIKIEVTYNDGTFAEISGGTGYAITPTTPLTPDDKSYTVTYGGKTASKDITVKPKEYTLELDSASKLKNTAYKSGDKFDATGMTLYIKQGTETKKTLKDKDLTDIFNYTIKDSDVGKTKLEIPFNYTYEGQKFTQTYTFSNLTITADKTALDVYDIVNIEMKKSAYPVGYRFTTADIDFIQYIQSRAGSVKKVYSEDFSKYSESIDIEVLTVNSNGKLTTKSSSSSSLRTIQNADVWTENNKKYVTLRVYVGNEDFDIDITIGDLGGVSVYYSSTLLSYYDDIMDALDAIEEGDSALTSYSSRTSGTYTIKLGEDQKVTKNYNDYDPERNISIDLNGYNLTFYSTTVQVSSRNRYSLSVTNTNTTTSKFEYYDLDEVLLIDKGETITFDADLDRDEVPGLYTVKIADTKNGTVSAKPAANRDNEVSIAHGNDITFTITPAENYQIDTVKVGTSTVSASSNKDYTLNANTGVATYVMKNVIKDGQTLTATFKELPKKEEPKKEETPAKTEWVNPFTDVSPRATYYDDVRFVNENGLMNGMSATTFGGSQTMTRAQFVTTLGRMYFSDYNTVEEKDAVVLRIYGTTSEFTDVSYNEIDIKYAVPYINWATANGLILGYGDGTFGPRDNITHQQMYIIMYRYATSLAKKSVNVSNETLRISDANKIGEFWSDVAREGALTAAKYAQQQNFLVSTGAMDPNGDAYRFELATLLHRFSVNVLGWID